MSLQLFSAPIPVFDQDGSAVLFPNFFDQHFFSVLRKELDWHEETVQLFGKTHEVPREVCYYGDEAYAYSGVIHPKQKMPEVVQEILHHIVSEHYFQFNSVLGNLYQNGEHGMGFHADDEPELDQGLIASASFGGTRTMQFKHRITKQKISFELPGQSLLLMKDCQKNWLHAIPKTKKPVAPRINLTFRRISAPEI